VNQFVFLCLFVLFRGYFFKTRKAETTKSHEETRNKSNLKCTANQYFKLTCYQKSKRHPVRWYRNKILQSFAFLAALREIISRKAAKNAKIILALTHVNTAKNNCLMLAKNSILNVAPLGAILLIPIFNGLC